MKENWKNLAFAICNTAVKDYIANLRNMRRYPESDYYKYIQDSLDKFFYSDYFQLLNGGNPKFIINEIKKQAKKREGEEMARNLKRRHKQFRGVLAFLKMKMLDVNSPIEFSFRKDGRLVIREDVGEGISTSIVFELPLHKTVLGKGIKYLDKFEFKNVKGIGEKSIRSLTVILDTIFEEFKDGTYDIYFKDNQLTLDIGINRLIVRVIGELKVVIAQIKLFKEEIRVMS